MKQNAGNGEQRRRTRMINCVVFRRLKIGEVCMCIVRGLRAWVSVRAGSGCGRQGGIVSQRRKNARESGEDDWEAGI
jgi:hypothetical protein